MDRVAGKGAEAWRVHHAALQQRASGRNVILLTVGDPDQSPPPSVIAATIKALQEHRTGYAPIAGFPDVRAAIAARFQRFTGRPCDADNVVVVPGAQAGLYCAMQCLAGTGDEVIVGEPSYATYEAVVGASGALMVTVPLAPERGFHPDVDQIAQSITPRTRVIWINSPHNPTGAVLGQEEIERIAALCREHNIWLLSDEVYETLGYTGAHISPWSVPHMSDRTVVVSSLSKSYAIPGYRFGWVIAPNDLVKHLLKLVLCIFYGASPFVQAGALEALTHDLPEASAMRNIYSRRAKLLADILATAPGCKISRPEGGMFLMLDVRDTGICSEDFALELLEREGVAVLPCDGFGPSAYGHLRISLTAPDAVLGDAGSRIVRFAGSLN
nr:pyridoxal phosphate-dependent aminotransferase [uncultured Rhodopila sp.]